MHQNQLELFIDDYLKEVDKKRIQNISIFIPGHSGHFWIINSAVLSFDLATLTFKPKDSFSLAIYFSFNAKKRKEKYLTDRIATSGCFKDFTTRIAPRHLEYFKGEYIDKKEIIEKIKVIVLSLFPAVEYKDIVIKLNRLDNWITLEDQNIT